MGQAEHTGDAPSWCFLDSSCCSPCCWTGGLWKHPAGGQQCLSLEREEQRAGPAASAGAGDHGDMPSVSACQGSPTPHGPVRDSTAGQVPSLLRMLPAPVSRPPALLLERGSNHFIPPRTPLPSLLLTESAHFPTLATELL